jgi:hypothetical protein
MIAFINRVPNMLGMIFRNARSRINAYLATLSLAVRAL